MNKSLKQQVLSVLEDEAFLDMKNIEIANKMNRILVTLLKGVIKELPE